MVFLHSFSLCIISHLHAASLRVMICVIHVIYYKDHVGSQGDVVNMTNPSGLSRFHTNKHLLHPDHEPHLQSLIIKQIYKG